MALTCCSHFGDGMLDLIPDSRVVEKLSFIRPTFGSEREELTGLLAISIERRV